VEKRRQQRGETLPPDHAAWQLEAHYVALAVVNLIYCFSSQRVVLGGGVMQQPGIIDRVRGEVRRTINNYLQTDRITRDIQQLIAPPGLGMTPQFRIVNQLGNCPSSSSIFQLIYLVTGK
jgi:fructokinase